VTNFKLLMLSASFKFAWLLTMARNLKVKKIIGNLKTNKTKIMVKEWRGEL
jgi:hypothetical protein